MGARRIEKVAVLGAGTMGTGITGQLVNAGLAVTLLDATIEQAVTGLSRAKVAKPPHFMIPSRAESVRVGALQDSTAWIHEADWVIEAVNEDPSVKAAVYQTIAPHLRADAFLTTNTSGLPIATLAEAVPPGLRSRFVGTHFFNPPRYLKLLELIPTPHTDRAFLSELSDFLVDRLGRRVVRAKDTPGFIANRLGMWSMMHAVHVAERLQLTVEQVDFLTGPFLGRPKSGSFRLNDLVGLDVMDAIAAGLRERCPHDPGMSTLLRPPSMEVLISRGWIGEKAGQGYYRREGKELLAFDLVTHAYRQRRDAEFPELEAMARQPLLARISEALRRRDEAGEFLRLYLLPTLQYAESVRAEIAHTALDVDQVMQWGFGWEQGPFALRDGLTEFLPSPTIPYYTAAPAMVLNDTGGYSPVPVEPQFQGVDAYPLREEFRNFSVRDFGDGISGVVLTTKMGVITPDLVQDLLSHFSRHEGPTVLTTAGPNASVGFDLKFFLSAIEREAWAEIEAALENLQTLAGLLAQRPIVAAVQGHCLGGGFELFGRCPVLVAGPETKIGLPEARVGLIPGGGGTLMMRLRNQDAPRRLPDVAVQMAGGETSTCAEQARTLGYLRPTDIAEIHPDRVLWTAIQRVKVLSVPPEPTYAPIQGPISGMIDRALDEARKRGTLTDYDVSIGERLRTVFTKPVNVDTALAMERKEFIELCRKGQTVARIRHMIEHKTPLRN